LNASRRNALATLHALLGIYFRKLADDCQECRFARQHKPGNGECKVDCWVLEPSAPAATKPSAPAANTTVSKALSGTISLTWSSGRSVRVHEQEEQLELLLLLGEERCVPWSSNSLGDDVMIND
jgi:hypothetical protein